MRPIPVVAVLTATLAVAACIAPSVSPPPVDAGAHATPFAIASPAPTSLLSVASASSHGGLTDPDAPDDAALARALDDAEARDPGEDGDDDDSGGKSHHHRHGGKHHADEVVDEGAERIAIRMTADALSFAIVGDTRPATPEDTRGYPVDAIKAIWARIAQERPALVVATGDYVFAHAHSKTAATQLDFYLSARKVFPGPFFPAMGNHECTGLTASNCGAGTKDGVTRPYTAFLSKMLGPAGVNRPWYSVRVDSSRSVAKPWSAKFLFVAPNAWNSTQESWLNSAMEEKTTYTFVVRHEPAKFTTAPGVRPSNRIIDAGQTTLSLVGHVHTYRHDEGDKELLVGNGGAPSNTATASGYVIARRRESDGVLELASIRADDGSVVEKFAVDAEGAPR